MDYILITNENFNSVQDYISSLPEVTGLKYSHTRQADSTILFEANFVACPCIYYIKENDIFAFGFDVNQVVDYAISHGIKLSDNHENLDKLNANIHKHVKASVSRRYTYNVNYIEKWSKVILDSNGEFTVVENDFVPFTKDFKESYDDVKAFLLKYKDYINTLIDEKRFLPTLTGGLDTRTLSGLYRDRVSELPGYFLMDVKWDGKNNVKLGQLELELADNVAYEIGLKQNRMPVLYNENNYISITGMFNENADSYENPNDPDYIYKIVQHAWADDVKYKYEKELVPYFDEDWLQFKQCGERNKLVLFLLLRPELVNTRFISGAHLLNFFPHGLTFASYPLNAFNEALDVINYWGLDKVKTILKA